MSSITSAEPVCRELGRTVNTVRQERMWGTVDGLWVGVWKERQGVEGVPVREAMAGAATGKILYTRQSPICASNRSGRGWEFGPLAQSALSGQPFRALPGQALGADRGLSTCSADRAGGRSTHCRSPQTPASTMTARQLSPRSYVRSAPSWHAKAIFLPMRATARCPSASDATPACPPVDQPNQQQRS